METVSFWIPRREPIYVLNSVNKSNIFEFVIALVDPSFWNPAFNSGSNNDTGI